MPSLTLPDGRMLWFAHCPKAGGTSVETLLVAAFGDRVGHLHWGWDLWWRDGGWRVAAPPNSPQHLTWDDARAGLTRPPDASFALVRDPLARMASERRWQARGRRGHWLGKTLARLPFPLWLRLMLAIRAQNPYAFDNHLRPQSDFVPQDAQVFRLEDGMDPVAEWLSETTGARLPAIPHRLATRATAPSRTASAARVAVAFAGDYDRFGYSRPPGAPPPPDCLDRVLAPLARLLARLERRGRL